MKRSAWCFILAALFLAPLPALADSKELYVSVPVLDVRSVPEAGDKTLKHDPHQETQLLYGEKVAVLEERDGWARIEAVEQEEWTHEKRWQGYPGWVERSGLSTATESWEPNLVITETEVSVRAGPQSNSPILMKLFVGTRVTAIEEALGWWHFLLLDGTQAWIEQFRAEDLGQLSARMEADLREKIVIAAVKMIGRPYYWGGRSSVVDCSGLTHLSHRCAGVSIPRDAHEQWMRARQIDATELQPADLIFLADPKDAKRITHVMLYGGGQIIEAPGTGKRVHQMSLQKRLKQAQKEKRQVYFGSFLP